MTMQCDPAKLRVIGEADVIEHFHLPQCHISSLPEGVPFKRDQYVVSLTVAESAEFIKWKFVRLSRHLIPIYKGERLKDLRKHCKTAHASEEFFLTAARNLWLRTIICTVDSKDAKAFIRSNVLPYESYWRRPLGDEPSSRVHFPSHIIEEVDDHRLTLGKALSEWKSKSRPEDVGGEECDVSKHKEDDQRRPAKTFWAVRDGVLIEKLNKGGLLWQVTWRGGTFVKKVAAGVTKFKREVNAMENLCHPHIVYIFGIHGPISDEQGSLYMEYMDNDLHALIIDIHREGGDNGPPFTHYNSVDILLQIAKAMAYMHRNEVIHGDLKSSNVLVNKFEITENQCRYLVKVADFDDSRRIVSPFEPAPGSTLYAAPEVLKFRDRPLEVSIRTPEYIDVYSFGLVAFEVLTGKTMPEITMGRDSSEFKEEVMKGDWKPSLRSECRQDKFLRIDVLMSLIERCWDTGTSERSPQRPLFPEIVEVLNAVREQIPEDYPEMLQQEDAHEALQAEDASHEVLHPEEVPERAKPRRSKKLMKWLKRFSCASGGNVQD